jgi:hypothetical protein
MVFKLTQLKKVYAWKLQITSAYAVVLYDWQPKEIGLLFEVKK